MHQIVAEGVTKTYPSGEHPVEALRGVSFEIPKGAFVSFIGPSGSGKTTLLNLIGCLDKPSGGRLRVSGVDVKDLDWKAAAKFRAGTIGFIFQNFNLIPVLSAFENVEYPLVMVQVVPVSERRRRVRDLLEAVGMGGQQKKRPDQLSGGQKQRVAIARALVTNPELVLADEPTANLDHGTADTIIKIMRKMREELNTTFVFSTHDTRIIGAVDAVYSLEDGRLASREWKGGGS
jgi:putative ABC transport system ATP-binding protein